MAETREYSQTVPASAYRELDKHQCLTSGSPCAVVNVYDGGTNVQLCSHVDCGTVLLHMRPDQALALAEHLKAAARVAEQQAAANVD